MQRFIDVDTNLGIYLVINEVWLWQQVQCYQYAILIPIHGNILICSNNNKTLTRSRQNPRGSLFLKHFSFFTTFKSGTRGRTRRINQSFVPRNKTTKTNIRSWGNCRGLRSQVEYLEVRMTDDEHGNKKT